MVPNSALIRDWLGAPPYLFAVTDTKKFTPDGRGANLEAADFIAPPRTESFTPTSSVTSPHGLPMRDGLIQLFQSGKSMAPSAPAFPVPIASNRTTEKSATCTLRRSELPATNMSCSDATSVFTS